MSRSKNSRKGRWKYTYMKFVKHFNGRKNRRATKRAIKEDPDKIPQGKQVEKENPWNWD